VFEVMPVSVRSITWETCFQVASTIAMAGWLALAIAGPQRSTVTRAVRYGGVGLLAAFYTALIARYLGTASGGFMSLEGVKRLLSSDPVILAGWIHYLALDLFCGTWITDQARDTAIPRPVHILLLLCTLMFGPIGLLLSYAVLLWRSGRLRT
jgi:Domain of unknown function (DUF4281)